MSIKITGYLINIEIYSEIMQYRYIIMSIYKKIRKKLKKNPFIYSIYKMLRKKQEKKDLKNRIECIHKYGYSLLNEVTETLVDAGIRSFCCCGTLLGLIRDGKFISWDDDIDMSIIDDPMFSWEILEEKLNGIGMKKFREFAFDEHVTIQSYVKNNVMIDFGLQTIEGNRVIMKEPWQIDGVEYLDGFYRDHRVLFHEYPIVSEIEMKKINGTKVMIPVNYEEYLESKYTKNWKIPDPDWITKAPTEAVLPVKSTYYFRRKRFRG
jgi:hypothetical protein